LPPGERRRGRALRREAGEGAGSPGAPRHGRRLPRLLPDLRRARPGGCRGGPGVRRRSRPAREPGRPVLPGGDAVDRKAVLQGESARRGSRARAVRRRPLPQHLAGGRAGDPLAVSRIGEALHASRALAALPDARLLEAEAQALRPQDLLLLPDRLGEAAAALALRAVSERGPRERGPLPRSVPLHAGATPRRAERSPDARPASLRPL